MRRVLNLLMLLMMSSSLMSAEIILQNPDVHEQAPSFSGINSYGEQINLSDFIAVSYTHLTLPTICSV